MGTVMLPTSLNPTKSGARDAASNHQGENKQVKTSSSVVGWHRASQEAFGGQSDYKAREAQMGR